MLNHSVAPSECFSFFAEKMRCAMYPPPPGSAPGYQLAHQFKLSSTKKLRKKPELGEGIIASVSRCRGASNACTCCVTDCIPPTAFTAKQSSTITMLNFHPNCTNP